MISNGIRHALDHDDYRLVLESAIGDSYNDRLRSEERFLRRIGNDRDIEGVMLYYLGADVNRPALEALREAGIPMVFLDRLPPAGFDADYVGVDNVRAADHAVKHLLRLGHHSIAHVSNLDTASTIEERQAGYVRALERAHIPVRKDLVAHDSLTGERCDSTVDIMEYLLSRPDPPTAVFAVNDEVAFRVIAALRIMGRRVPDDVAVVGFDGVSADEHWMPEPPFLSTMCQPFEQMGAKAVELLLERIEHGPPGSYKHILLEAPLRVGGSTQGKEAVRRHVAV
jgi:LacI family transcriptional regulator